MNMKHRFNQATALLLSFGVAAPAFAAEGLGDTVSTAITAAGPEVTTVIAAVAGVLVIIVAWQLIKRAMK